MAEQRTDLNTADAEELSQLPGIGPVLAQRIVRYRDTVHAFEEPADITAVTGIGQKSYRLIADRLTVAPPEEGSPATPAEASLPEEEGGAASPAPSAEQEAGGESSPEPEEEAPPEETEPQMEVIPPGESLSEQGMPLPEETREADLGEAPSGAQAITEGAAPETEDEWVEEEAPSEARAIPPGESVSEQAMPLEQEAGEADVGEAPAGVRERTEEAALGAEDEPVEEEAVPEAEEPVEEDRVEEDLPSVSLPPPSERSSPPPRRRLSWLWTALLGGILGMIFALIVFAGINGSLDVGHSRAVLRIESGLDGLTADVQTLETDVEGLRRRLDALEGLTSRMDDVESAVSDLVQETSDLSERTAALESEVAAALEELQQVSESVVTLEDQAERTRGFFSGLQMLMSDIFGDAEGMSAPTPTPEGK